MVQFPTVQFISQNPAINPSGSRHLLSGGAGFLKLLNTSAAGELNFGTINNTISGVISDTKVVYARINSLGDASGIFNMRFFLNSVSDFNTGNYRFLERKYLHFIPNITLGLADQDTTTIMPTSTNLLGTIQFPQFQAGAPWISGILDNDVTQYIALALYVDTNVPATTYGGAGGGSFRYSLAYDFS